MLASRQKISATHIALWASRPVPVNKLCGDCRETKPLEEFYSRKLKRVDGSVRMVPSAACKNCTNARGKLWRAKNPQRVQDYRARHNKRRRLARERVKPPSKPKRPPKPKPHPIEFPIEPIAQLLERELAFRDQSTISAATGIAKRKIYGLLKREHGMVELATVDALLTGLGMPEEMHFLYPDETR